MILSGKSPFRRCVAGKVLERLPGSWQVAFALVEVNSLGGGGVRLGAPAGCFEDMNQIEQDVGALAEKVGLRGERHRRTRQFLSFGVTSAIGEDPGQRSLADGPHGKVLVSPGVPAGRDQPDGFVVPARS